MNPLRSGKGKLKAWQLVKKGWCQGYYACTKDGVMCEYNDPRAVKWCIMGALDKVYPSSSGEAVHKIEKALGGKSLPLWNDAKGRTQAQVVHVLRRLDL